MRRFCRIGGAEGVAAVARGDGSLRVRRIPALHPGDEVCCAVARVQPGFPSGVPRRIEDLAAHRCAAVRHSGGVLTPWRFVRGGKGIEIAPEATLSVSDPEALIDLALAHAGIAQTGLHHALPFLRSGRLKLVLHGQHDAGEREFVLHYPHRQFLAPRVRVVVDALMAHFAAAADLHVSSADVSEYAARRV
jgi:DNA-binding transcriptional LysR family regulator